jgi:hypothetical protein
MKQRALRILWPAFMAAGVLEMMTFAVIDPADLHWFSGPAIGWSRQVIYTVTFLIYWVAIAAASATTALLSAEPQELNPPQQGR